VTALRTKFSLVCTLLVASVGGAPAEPRSSRRDPEAVPRAAPVGPTTSVPAGWVDFCVRHRGECSGGRGHETAIVLDEPIRARIESINRFVNATIVPVTDMESWGVADRWDYPDIGKGDCEDFALMKRRLLLAEALPGDALLLTVVKDSHNDGHGVLMVRTNQGDFILDNLTDEVKLWHDTGYRFVKRQSQSDPSRWVQLDQPTSAPEIVSR
jgi:predicted transglutaminase-like cysteine proteinase